LPTSTPLKNKTKIRRARSRKHNAAPKPKNVKSTVIAGAQQCPQSIDKRKRLIHEIRLQQQEEKRQCEQSYEYFVRCAWDVIEAENKLEWNWHLTYLCNLVQSEIERIGNHRIKIWDVILINVPPRTLKSMIFSRMMTAWAWIKYPWMRFMQGSYSDVLAIEHAVECRDIIRSEWYQRNWGDMFQLKDDQDNKSHYRTNANGARFTFSTTSKATGRGGNVISFDDPESPEQAESVVERTRANRVYKRTLSSRLNNKKIDIMIIIMQRLHEDDVTGHIIENEMKTRRKKVLHICLPAEETPWINPPELRKMYVDGLLFPSRLSRVFLENEKISDPYGFSGQYLQRPTPEEGGDFPRRKWRYWQWPGQHLPQIEERIGMETFTCEVVDRPQSFDDMQTSWDMTFKDKETSDYVSGHGIAKKGPQYYVLEKEFYEKVGFTQACDAVLKLNAYYPNSTQTLVESAANGPAVINVLQSSVNNFKDVTTNRRDNTFSYAKSVSKIQQAGNLILPHPQLCPWVVKRVENFAAYPHGANDDEVSSICQGVHSMQFSNPVWPMAKLNLKNVTLPWRDLPQYIMLYISQWVQPDLSSSVIIAAHNQTSGVLAILDDIEISSSLPEIIIPAINHKVQIITRGLHQNHRRFIWLGNNMMHGYENSMRTKKVKDSIADTYSSSGVKIESNEFYDERGSIVLTSKMFYMNSVVFNSASSETNRQCVTWNIEGDKPSGGYGCARALCNMIFSLYQTGKFQKKKKRMAPYSQQHEKFKRDLDWADKAGQIEKFIKENKITKTTKTNKDSWMSV